MIMAPQTPPKIKPGWRDDGLEAAVEVLMTVPKLDAVLERESALLGQNIVSAMRSATHEDQVASLVNAECKKALARSMLVGLEHGGAFKRL
jgi:hypothetical protein